MNPYPQPKEPGQDALHKNIKATNIAKDINPVIYHDYTECDNLQMLDNLRWLLGHDGLADRIIVRLPLIPEYNTLQDRDHSKEILAEMGVVHFDEFEYTI